MYGGHITDPWDRRTNSTYLSVFFKPGIYSAMEIAPGYKCPEGKLDYGGFLDHVDKELPTETPVMFRLHPNAEITYLTAAMTDLFQSIMILSGCSGGGGGGGGDGTGAKETVKQYILTSIFRRI